MFPSALDYPPTSSTGNTNSRKRNAVYISQSDDDESNESQFDPANDHQSDDDTCSECYSTDLDEEIEEVPLNEEEGPVEEEEEEEENDDDDDAHSIPESEHEDNPFDLHQVQEEDPTPNPLPDINIDAIFSNDEDLLEMKKRLFNAGYPEDLMFGQEMLRLVGIKSITADSIEFASDVWKEYDPVHHANYVGVYFKCTNGHIHAPNAKPQLTRENAGICIQRHGGSLGVYTGKTVNSFKSRFADYYHPEFHEYAGVDADLTLSAHERHYANVALLINPGGIDWKNKNDVSPSQKIKIDQIEVWMNGLCKFSLF
jgi:hypothetical protein